MRHLSYAIAVLLTCYVASARAVYLGADPGAATAALSSSQFTLADGAISATWKIDGNRVNLTQLAGTDGKNLVGAAFSQTDQFVLNIGGTNVTVSNPNVARLGAPQLRRVTGIPSATQLGDRSSGYEVSVPYRYTLGGNTLDINYIVSIRDGSNYVQQRVELQAGKGTFDMRNVGLANFSAVGGALVGNDDGRVFTSGSIFAGQENAMTKFSVAGNKFTGSAGVCQQLLQGQTLVQSAVLGVAPANQLRRGFEYYLNRQRAAPYHSYLHYNSWYDISPGLFTEAQCLGRIEKFKQKLFVERGVSMDGFAFDDPWDNPSASSVWEIAADRFPDGWQNMKAAAASMGAGLGAWMSPFGGYGSYHDQRIAAGKKLGYEIANNGFQLSGPNYNERFTAAARDFIANQGANYFKFDGIGGGLYQTGPAAWAASDYEAEFKLIQLLRARKPDLFVNATVGSWHSPFYLMNTDSIWRDGNDWGFVGTGTTRAKSVTYRDDQIYHNVVKGNALFPIHSLMAGGIIVAEQVVPDGLRGTPELADFKNDVRALFGMGINCLELYISPDRLTDVHWDALAETIKWAKSKEAILEDSHWIGGDPSNGDIYGAAAWIPGKGTIMLRNPSSTTKTFTLNLSTVFELAGMNQDGKLYNVHSPWAEDASQTPLLLKVGDSESITLTPYQVLVFDAVAVPEPGAATLLGTGLIGLHARRKIVQLFRHLF